MQPIIWVARPDKTGWNATRARDRVDYSFCVYRETDKFPARLVVRETYTDKPGARARKVVGEFVFPTAKQAKGMVVVLLDMLNDELNYPSNTNDRTMLRAVFMSKMMVNSVLNSESKYHTDCIWYYELFTGDITRPNSPFVSASAYAVVNSPFASNPSVTEEDHVVMIEGELWAPLSMGSLQNDVDEAMKMLEQAEQIIELPPEPEFDPKSWCKGDPVPTGWIAMGDKVVQLSWPK